MILDSSAVIAILFREPGYEELVEKLYSISLKGIGAPTLAECGIVLSARMNRDSRGVLARFLEEMDVSVIAFSNEHYSTALAAWLKYGKGRHVAGLNFGDCLAYAVAKVAGMPLLFVGEDFPKTDISVA